MLISRADRGLLANWWFTVDRVLLMTVLILMALGVLFSMAASPPVAARLGLPDFHFFNRQLVYVVPGLVVLFAASLLDLRSARRVSLVIFVVGLALMVAAIMVGPEIKGAHRWIGVGPIALQPSEFVKPAFVVMAAWFLAEGDRTPGMPGLVIAWLTFLAFAGVLVRQPDFGQTGLVSLVFLTMLLIRGISWPSLAGLGGTGLALAFLTYEMVPYVRSRVAGFINPDKGDNFQVKTALEAFGNGGLLGTGPGGGVAKQILPDAHTDFVAGSHRRGVRLPRTDGAARPHRLGGDPRAAAGPARSRRLRGAGHGRACHHVRPAGIDQSRGEHGARPRQGHDAAVHLLWRFIARRDSLRHGTGAGDEPAPSRGGAAGGHGCNDGVR